VAKVALEFPSFFLGLAGFNVVNDVIVDKGFHIFTVDETFELDMHGLSCRDIISISEVIVYHLDNLGPMRGTIILWWHEKGATNKLF